MGKPDSPPSGEDKGCTRLNPVDTGFRAKFMVVTLSPVFSVGAPGVDLVYPSIYEGKLFTLTGRHACPRKGT